MAVYMKRVALLALSLSVAAAVLPGCPCANLMFADSALESAVRAELGLPLGCLSTADLLRVTEIQAEGLNIRSLRGLELCSNLQVLNVQNNQITSLSPLTNLTNLQILDVGQNQISDIGAVAGLLNLDQLYIDGNDIFNLNALSANVLNGGLDFGDTVVLPNTILSDPSDTASIQAIYQPLVDTLLAAGINTFVEDERL